MSFVRPFRRFVAALFCALAASSAVHAQQFPQPTVIPTGNWPVSISTGDAQPQDGIADLLYCDPGAAGVSAGCHLLRGTGNGSFTKVEDYNGGGDNGIFTAAFLNFAGTPRQVVTLSTWTVEPKVLNILIQFGMGGLQGATFQTTGSVNPIPGQIQYIVYDNNNPTPLSDTNRGFIAQDIANGTLYSVPIDSTQVIASLPNIGTGGFITGDFDGDGKTDILAPSATNAIAFYHGKGDGTFTPGNNYTLTGGIFSMLVHDIDGDGISDLVVEGANGSLSYFPGSSTGFSTTAVPLTGAQDGTTGNGGHLIAIADLNNDGIFDILTSTPAGVSVLLGQGGLSYKLGGIYNAGPGRSSYAVADFNGDNHLDLAVDSPEGIAILFGNPDGSFQTSQAYATAKPADAIALGSFTGSGNTDVLVANEAPRLLAGDGKGAFVLTPTPIPLTAGPGDIWAVAAGDFDGDGVLDAAFFSQGTLFLPPIPDPPLPPGTICSCSTFTFPATTVFFDKGTGTGQFYSQEDSTYIGFSAASLPLDYNGDGIGDLANFTSGSCAVYYSPTTDAPSEIPLFYDDALYGNFIGAVGYLRTGSMNKQDIVCQARTSIHVFRNNGDGTFKQTANFPNPSSYAVIDNSGFLPTTGLLATTVLLQDLDGDGNGDLIVVYRDVDTNASASASGSSVYIYWGNGDGTFTTSPLILSPQRNNYLAAVADIDGDGHPDLLLSDGYLLTVLPGKGTARTLAAERHLLAGMGINAIATTTMEGHTALITANGGNVLSNPVANRGSIVANAEVNTGAITVFVRPHVGTSTAAGTLTIAPISPGYGRTFTLTATLAPSSPAPTGTVDFSIDGFLVGTGMLTSGVATYTVNTPAYTVGTHTLTAVYSGDATYSTLNLPNSQFNVSLLPSQTSMTNVVPSIYYGQIIGDIAVGTEAALNPTDTASLVGGSISFSIATTSGTTVVCTLPVNGTAQSCPSPTGSGYSAGNYTLSAMYSGNQFYSGSVSQNYPVTVQADATQGTLTSSLNPATVGQPVTLTAVFTAPFATPVGAVTFFDGANSIGPGTLDSTGTATLTTLLLPAGAHSITAVYAGTANFNASSTPAFTETISPPPLVTSTTLTSSANPSMLGQNVTFTATVVTTPSAAIPTGNVTFMVDGATLNPAPLNAQGAASFSVNSLTLGSHTIVATYNGASTGTTFASSTVALTQRVNIAGNFSFTITPSSVSVPIGNTGSTLITISPLNGFNQPIELSCSGLPSEATCAFGTTIISGAGGSTVLGVYATAPHTCGTTQPYFITHGGSTTWFGLFTASGLLFLLRRRRRLLKGIILALALCILPALGGCGNCTDLGVEPGTYTFTVTARSTGSPSVTASQTIKMVAHL